MLTNCADIPESIAGEMHCASICEGMLGVVVSAGEGQETTGLLYSVQCYYQIFYGGTTAEHAMNQHHQQVT